jgi:hypothetical protein
MGSQNILSTLLKYYDEVVKKLQTEIAFSMIASWDVNIIGLLFSWWVVPQLYMVARCSLGK